MLRLSKQPRVTVKDPGLVFAETQQACTSHVDGDQGWCLLGPSMQEVFAETQHAVSMQ